jgi:hypothetical protein
MQRGCNSIMVDANSIRKNKAGESWAKEQFRDWA